MNRYLQSGIVLFAGILGGFAAHADRQPVPIYRKTDVREAILRRFLNQMHSPAEPYSENFIREADAYQLDWRLLPSLAVVESGAGQKCRGNNLFGWANGDRHFSTIADGIHHVAEALAGARAYKGKDLRGKLAAYNRTPGYRNLVTTVMKKIYPDGQPETAAQGPELAFAEPSDIHK